MEEKYRSVSIEPGKCYISKSGRIYLVLSSHNKLENTWVCRQWCAETREWRPGTTVAGVMFLTREVESPE
jgi:hypothetical protein